MKLSSGIFSIWTNLKNMPGQRLTRNILVIECDDWGGIRMPSRYAYKELLKMGYPVDKNRYTKYDTLESGEDLDCLFEILQSVVDKNGHAAVFTAVTNVANPDFEKIKASGYSEYHYEPFTKTLEIYKRNPDTFSTWLKGMRSGIFVPELHGREHLSVQLWLEILKSMNEKDIRAFDLGFVAGQAERTHCTQNYFRPEFCFSDKKQISFLMDSIRDGAALFKNIFGSPAKIFVPSNSVFHPAFEKTLAENKIQYLCTSLIMNVPTGKGDLKKKCYFAGEKKSGIARYHRNCVFEPTHESYTGIELTMKQINAAFRWGKPAIISTHRVNYAGGIHEKNRAMGLAELKILLQAVVRKWPDVEFMSAADMLKIRYDRPA